MNTNPLPLKEMSDYIDAKGGMLYAPIDLPFFDGIPIRHPDRTELFIKELKKHKIKTVADIGCHWGANAVKLAKQFKVTAYENDPKAFKVLEFINKELKAGVSCMDSDITAITAEYDAIINTMLFHHFIREKELYEGLVRFCKSWNFKVMIFQAHEAGEPYMTGIYKEMTPLQLAEHVAELTGKKRVKLIADLKRPIYKIY